MGFWDNLKASASRMSTGLKTKVAQFKNSNFADASMATCALIAAADGTIDDDERRRTAEYIAQSDVLQVFNIADLRAKFDLYCQKLQGDFAFGKIELIQVIGKLRSSPDQARAVVQVGVIIGGADGDFDAEEKAVLREVCYALQLNPAEFEL